MYDVNDRLIQQTAPFGNATTISYDEFGNTTETIDRNGRRVTFEYDNLFRRTSENWWSGADLVRYIDFAYDPVGNLLSVSDPDRSYSYTYDPLHRLC